MVLRFSFLALLWFSLILSLRLSFVPASYDLSLKSLVLAAWGLTLRISCAMSVTTTCSKRYVKRLVSSVLSRKRMIAMRRPNRSKRNLSLPCLVGEDILTTTYTAEDLSWIKINKDHVVVVTPVSWGLSNSACFLEGKLDLRCCCLFVCLFVLFSTNTKRKKWRIKYF